LYSDGEPPNEPALIPETVSPGSTKALVDLVAWCFEVKQDGGGSSWADQRLGFFQVRVAQLLDDADPKQRGETLLRQAGELLASMNGQWRTFIEGRIQGYLDEQKELDELVDVTIRSFGEQSGTLTKSLIDTLLAAVAALIGSTVAAAFKDPFNAGLFRLGMLVYAAYVLLFPAVIGLSVQVGRFRAEQRSYESRRQRFANLLGEHQVNTLEGKRISAAKSSFWFWFWVAVGGFVVAIVGSLVAVLTVPGVIGG